MFTCIYVCTVMSGTCVRLVRHCRGGHLYIVSISLDLAQSISSCVYLWFWIIYLKALPSSRPGHFGIGCAIEWVVWFLPTARPCSPPGDLRPVALNILKLGISSKLCWSFMLLSSLKGPRFRFYPWGYLKISLRIKLKGNLCHLRELERFRNLICFMQRGQEWMLQRWWTVAKARQERWTLVIYTINFNLNL